MNGTFNDQILVEKLAKLNNSQQSIETLSHWCIFHRKKAKQVVETWNRQFHCSRRDQRVSFLYLANDILQNSRRKGFEFVNEFWKILPDALNDVIQNGDGSGRNAALRLIDIWEERKVFGSRVQILKEELLVKNVEGKTQNGKSSGLLSKTSVGGALEKIISSYEVVYGGYMDEESVLTKCRTAISCMDRVEEEVVRDENSDLSEVVEELQGQCNLIGECIEQLRAAESARATLVSHLRGILQDEEFKLDQLRSKVQVAQSRSDQAGTTIQQFLASKDGKQPSERPQECATFSKFGAPDFVPEGTGCFTSDQLTAPVAYIQQHMPSAECVLSSEDDHRITAASVAAKLVASTSSAQMLSYVLSSLASEGVIGNMLNESSPPPPPMDLPPDKRPKHENGLCTATQLNQSFSHTETLQHMPSNSPHQAPLPPTSSPMSPAPPAAMPPPLPQSLPPPPPLPPQLVQPVGSMPTMPYSYGTVIQHPTTIPGFPMMVAPMSGLLQYSSPLNMYQSVQMPDSCYFGQQPLPATPSVSRH